MTLAEQPTHLWEKQPYDSEKGYQYFWEYYVNAGESKRGYLHAYNAYRRDRGKPPAKSLPGNWGLWAKGVNREGKGVAGRATWAERVAAYEQYVTQERQKALRKKILEDAEKWAREQELVLEKERDYANRLYEMADVMLAMPLLKRKTTVTQDGQTQVIVKPAGWRLRDVVTVLRTASDLKRRGLLMQRDGPEPEDNWRQTLLNLGLDPDDPDSWLDLYYPETQAVGQPGGRGPTDKSVEE
jgi:hypothetical protein